MGGSLGVHRAAASREPDGEEELVLRRPVFDVLSLEPFIPFRLLAVVIKAGSGAELAQPVVAKPLEDDLEEMPPLRLLLLRSQTTRAPRQSPRRPRRRGAPGPGAGRGRRTPEKKKQKKRVRRRRRRPRRRRAAAAGRAGSGGIARPLRRARRGPPRPRRLPPFLCFRPPRENRRHQRRPRRPERERQRDRRTREQIESLSPGAASMARRRRRRLHRRVRGQEGQAGRGQRLCVRSGDQGILLLLVVSNRE